MPAKFVNLIEFFELKILLKIEVMDLWSAPMTVIESYCCEVIVAKQWINRTKHLNTLSQVAFDSSH